MQRSLFFLCLCCALVAGCSTPPAAPEKTLTVSAVGIENPRMQQFLASTVPGQLSRNLGWVEYARSWRAEYPDGREALLVPMEAEDEVRMLVVFCGEDGTPLRATVLGFAETNWFSRARAETLQAFEGWLFLYDLAGGMRRISAYYEAGQLREHTTDYPEDAAAFDLLQDGERFACLALMTAAPPMGVVPRLFLVSDEEQARMIAETAAHLCSPAS